MTQWRGPWRAHGARMQHAAEPRGVLQAEVCCDSSWKCRSAFLKRLEPQIVRKVGFI